jgi:pentatricopeptide repeat protein
VTHKFCHDGQLTEARKCFEQMQNKGLIHDVYSHNSLIDGYCKHGDMDKAFHFLKLK